MSANGRGDGLSTPWSAAMAEKTWWAPREVNLTLSAAAATSFVIFSLFGREAEGAAFPEQKSWCRTKKFMKTAHSAVAELPVTQLNHFSPSKVSVNSFSFLLLSAANLSCFLDSFAMLPCQQYSLPFSSGPFGRRGSPCLLLRWVMEEEVAGAAMSNSDAKCPWRRASETLSPSD
ncbi:hypothetical protein GWK47_023745 [Chionoecetes opilio]|uniref:Uncharacterized protein n=1 Tax=Chionoecetes opilio TaxID=41210 RepID=A0A8J4XLJ7_CHIOP|nr:hypothetical protein GWK47_023745 [Chionoecetes opilio]